MPGFVVGVNATDPGHDLTQIIYSISASERESPQIKTTKPYFNMITFYCIGEPEHDGVIFAIQPTSGIVTVHGPIDRERESRYVFHVQVSKMTKPL